MTISDLRERLAHATHLHLIDNQPQASADGAVFETRDPASGEVLATVARGGAADVDAAVAAARAAFEAGPWRAMPYPQRAGLLHRLADLIEANLDELALIESLDNGMTLMAAKMGSIRAGAGALRYNAGWIGKLDGRVHEMAIPNHHAYSVREPVGVVALIVPWNFPFAMTLGKLAPALAAGCTVVIKPSELTPLSVARLGELVREAGFPAGVVNIVQGDGAVGAALVDHPGVDKVSFTGSTQTGKQILVRAAATLKRVTLELGGKSPNLLFADADLPAAIAGSARAIFGNAGQVCVAGSRLFVERSVHDQVVEGLVAAARALNPGPGTVPGHDLGPLISATQRERVLGYVQSGLGEGAQLLTGGQAIEGPGYFVAPTVLTGVRDDMKVMREEIFGPVLCVTAFDADDLEPVIAQANDSDFGLSALVWTRALSRAHTLASRLRAGTVRINGGTPLDFGLPFGGYKQSGIGRENGLEGVLAYTELKSVSIAL